MALKENEKGGVCVGGGWGRGGGFQVDANNTNVQVNLNLTSSLAAGLGPLN